MYLSEGYRVGDKTRTKNLKKYKLLDELEKNEPGAYERLRNEAKAGLLTRDEPKHIDVQLNLNTAINQVSPNYGWLLLDDLYKSLKLGTVTVAHQSKSSFEYDLDKILKFLIFSRVLKPCSKLKTVETQKDLFGNWDVEAHDMYRSLDEIAKLEEQVQIQLNERITDSIGRDGALVFYDVTNYYFQADYDDLNEHDDEGNITYESLRK